MDAAHDAITKQVAPTAHTPPKPRCTRPFLPQDQLGHHQVSQTFLDPPSRLSSNSQEAEEAEEEGDEDVRVAEEVAEEEAAQARDRWHSHDSLQPQQLQWERQTQTSITTTGTCASAVDSTYQDGTQAKRALHHAEESITMKAATVPTTCSTKHKDTRST